MRRIRLLTLMVAVWSAAMLSVWATPSFAAASVAADWTIALRKAVQLDPERGERMAVEYEARARALPQSDEQRVLVLTAQYFRSEALLQLHRARAAMPIVDEALRDIPGTPAGNRLKGQFLMVRAGIHSEQGKAAASLADFHAAYKLFTAIKAPRNAAVALMGIGSIYQDAGDFNRVLYYYRLADEAYANDPMLGLSSANNQGNALSGLKRFSDAEASYRQAFTFARQLDSPLLEARILNNIAAMQIDLGHLPAASGTVTRGLAITDRDPAAKEWRPLLLGTAARLALAENRAGDAVKFVEQAVAGKTPASLTDQSYRDLHQVAYQAYSQAGRSDRALGHLEAFQKLDDEGRRLVTETNAALLAARFDFTNQNARISTLKAGQLRRDVALAQLRARQSAIVLGSLLAVATASALALGLYVRSVRRSRDAVRVANTALVDINAQLTHALSAKSRFLATTSHEIRTPLNGVLGMTQVLLAEPTLADDVRQRITLLQGAGESMRRLVDDILEYAKIDAGSIDVEKTGIDLHAMLKESVDFWRDKASSKGLSIDIKSMDTPRYIFEDGRRLRQIIFNLLANAVKFTETGGVTLSATMLAGSNGETLSIDVTDTGIGIPAAAFDSIFEMFSQVDTSTTRLYGGSGLGLAISLNLARALDGDLTVTSALDVGSTFSLRLPLVRGMAPAQPLAPVRLDAATELSQAQVMMVGGSPIAQQVIANVMIGQIANFIAMPSVADACADAIRSCVDVFIVDAATISELEFAHLAVSARTNEREPWLVVLMAAGASNDAGTGYEHAHRQLARPFTAAALMALLQDIFARQQEYSVPADANLVGVGGAQRQ